LEDSHWWCSVAKDFGCIFNSATPDMVGSAELAVIKDKVGATAVLADDLPDPYFFLVEVKQCSIIVDTGDTVNADIDFVRAEE
jgi:hypothetical protein